MSMLAEIRRRNALTYRVDDYDKTSCSVRSVTGEFICVCRTVRHAEAIALILTDASKAAAADDRELFPEIWDAASLHTFSGCPRSFAYTT